MINYYKVLGVSENATHSDIKKEFRKKSLIYHPDRPGGNAEKFKEINEAYEILGDEQNRKTYDFELKNKGNGIPDEFFQNEMFFRNMMNNFMNRNNGPVIFHNGQRIHIPQINRIMKPQPIRMTLSITLKQSYFGEKLPITINRSRINGPYRNNEQYIKYIDLPKGIDNNELIKLLDSGHIVENTVTGDVIIQIKIKEDEKFKRNGLNLIYNLDITLKQALLGFKTSINHINGKNYTVTNQENDIIKPNMDIKLDELGMIRDNKKGGLIIKFNIIFPDKLNDEQKNNLEKIL